MRGAVEVCGLVLGFLGCVFGFVSLHIDSWKESSDYDDVIVTSNLLENLWMSCAEDSTGTWNCWYFPSLLALPGYIQACRALMITAIAMGTFGLVATLVGMRCSRVGGENYVLKGRIAAVGGVFFILQGLCTMVAVSWYAANITREFFDPLYPGTKYEIGDGLYIGWSSGTLALIGGCCLLCSCNVKQEKLEYRFPPPSRGAGFTHSASSSQYGRNAYV
ncbi:claudin-15 isoform X2 [Astyanax mexicanus]|uniref:Claudin n=1 Tax=Astyanax mexicanus TaxID=7994 RepID=A0A8T2ML83_ASTMX|nr:claudin-15 isoform X2 [Astyanax mexicanus]KAG9281501.1 claudin-15-like isoform X2 [Astyanax mexicanus]